MVQDGVKSGILAAALATTTFYNPDREADGIRMILAKETLAEAVDLGYGVVCVDGGSPDEFRKYLETHGVQFFPEDKSEIGNHPIGKARRQAIREALRLSLIGVWTEPEKNMLPKNLKSIISPLKNLEADLVVMGRSSLNSYPTSQIHYESAGNQTWKEITGYDLDVWSGPRAFNHGAGRHFLDYKGEYGDKWDSTFIPIMDAIHAGKRVTGVTIPYFHPPAQTRIEEGNIDFTIKRLDQLNNLVPAFYKHQQKLKGTQK